MEKNEDTLESDRLGNIKKVELKVYFPRFPGSAEILEPARLRDWFKKMFDAATNRDADRYFLKTAGRKSDFILIDINIKSLTNHQ
jgi:hypothetical protein